MKIAIMQPYLFPYIGYFSLIKNTDFFVFFDTPQYIRKGWINRNRLLGAGGKDIYFTVPIEKCPRETPIRDVKISFQENWIEKMRGQLSFYKKRAPYYKQVSEVVNTVYEGGWRYISEMATASVTEVCSYLGIDMQYDIFSGMQLPAVKADAPDEWALEITKSLGYDTYVNPPGGKSFFDIRKYREAGIRLQFLTPQLREYNQRVKEFVPGLSILDVMMFCSPEEIREMLDSFFVEGDSDGEEA